MKSSHIHAEIEFNLVLRGALHYSFGGRRVPVVAGELAVFWAALPHQLDAIEGDTQAYWLTLPLPTFLGFDLPPALVQSLLRGELLRETADLPSDEARFATWQDDIARGEERPALLEIEARLRRLARTISAPIGEPKAPATPSELGRVERMAAFIAQNYALSISLPDIAGAANLNTNYASTLFKREFGSTLGDFLLRTRLAHAQRFLATTDKTIGDVAASCGFGSPARFHAAFKEKTGHSPRAYRVSCRGGKGWMLRRFVRTTPALRATPSRYVRTTPALRATPPSKGGESASRFPSRICVYVAPVPPLLLKEGLGVVRKRLCPNVHLNCQTKQIPNTILPTKCPLSSSNHPIYRKNSPILPVNRTILPVNWTVLPVNWMVLSSICLFLSKK